MRKLYWIIILIIPISILAYFGVTSGKKINPNTQIDIGEIVDSLDGVYVYFNGGVGNTSGRNLSDDGYNIGIRYQCVEFVKRYYYEHFNHKMPDSYGNALDFYDKSLEDSTYNPKRDLVQYANSSCSRPLYGDLIIFDATTYNQYGHVAIISAVTDSTVTIVQQNPGPFARSRATFPLYFQEDKWTIDHTYTLGWLRKQ